MSEVKTMTDAEFSQLTEWGPQFDDDAMNEIDSKWDDIYSRRSRRLLLSMLTMDSEKIFDCCEKDAETFFEGFRCSASTLGMYKRIVNLLDMGHHRLMVGLFGVDTDAPDAPFTKAEFFDAIGEAKGEDIDDDDSPSPQAELDLEGGA